MLTSSARADKPCNLRGLPGPFDANVLSPMQKSARSTACYVTELSKGMRETSVQATGGTWCRGKRRAPLCHARLGASLSFKRAVPCLCPCRADTAGARSQITEQPSVLQHIGRGPLV